MSTMTTVQQDCTSTVDALGVLVFKIVTSVTFVKEGDLPSAEIFVYQIVANADPKSDVFLRIATLADLSSLPRGRENALQASVTYYLSSSFSIQYSDITVATEAKGLVRARIDQLIADWILAQSSFYNPTTFELPAVESTVIEAAKSEYYAAKTTKVAADVAVLAALDAVAAAQAAATTANDSMTAASDRRSECVLQNSSLGAAVDATAALKQSCNDVIGQMVPVYENIGDPPVSTLTHYTLLKAPHDTFVGAVGSETATSSLTTLSDSMGSSCADRGTELNSAATAKTSADRAVATAQTDAQSAQAEATAAAAALDKALVKVLAYCPTFDPNA